MALHGGRLLAPMIQPNPDISGASVSSEEAAARTPSPNKSEIISLVQRANRGDDTAQAELVNRYTRRISGFIRTIIRQPDAIEDVTQMVFIKMFRRLGRLRDAAVFESWLFTLAR